MANNKSCLSQLIAMDSTMIPNELNISSKAEVTTQTSPILKKTTDWKAANLQYGYNMGHVYGTYEINVQAFLDWSAGPRDTNFVPEPTSHVKIYVTKADVSKKVVSVLVRTGATDRMVKMFEPMATHFINVIRGQLTDVSQNLVNLLETSQIPAIIRMPLSANGPIEDSLFNNKRQTEMKAIGYSVDIKSESDAVYPNTVLSNIHFMLLQSQA